MIRAKVNLADNKITPIFTDLSLRKKERKKALPKGVTYHEKTKSFYMIMICSYHTEK